MKTTKHITVLGRRWFQKTYGNTYHTVKVITDNEVLQSPVTYGYGSAYMQTAVQLLHDAGYSATWPLWRYCEDNNITLHEDVVDVTRQKDL